MTQRPHKRTALVASAAAVAAALTAGLTPQAVGQDAPTQVDLSGAAAQDRTQLTLITGDRVVLDGEGEVVGLIRADGREQVPVQVTRNEREQATYVIPADARPLIADGTLDRRLFNVTELSRDQYAATGGLPVIVGYEEGARPDEARAELFADDGATPEVTTTLDAVNAEAMTVSPAEAAATWQALTEPADDRPLAAAPGVAYVALDAVVQATLADSVPQIGAPEAWDAGFDGTDTTIAVLDTGISPDHPDVADKVVAEENFSDAPDAGDGFGHGTHVASIAAGTGARSDGTYTGVAPGASLLNGKVLDDEGYGQTSWVLAGMEWAVDQGADVINMSLGDYATTEIDPLEQAVNELSEQSDALFVVAAGNDGELGAETVGSPGTADAALTVGAVDKSDVLAVFSSRGPRLRDGAVKPDITAPGVAIGAAAAPGSVIEEQGTPVADGYVAIDGTSMATPHVAGAAALLAQQHPDWTGEDLKAALTSSATPGDYTAFEQGTGRVDVPAALAQTVVAEPNGLNFDRAEWPHDDDEPQTRELTYRNLGEEDVTLQLTVEAQRPDGEPAPEGFVALGSDEVTVPAGGSATVEATVDTTVPQANGFFTLDVVAEGGGQTVRAVGAVEREVESYDLAVEAVDRDGEPVDAASFNASLINLETGEMVTLPAGDEPVRVPAGRYLVDASFLELNENDELLALDWLTLPSLTVDADTSVTLDAREAEPVEISVPDEEATLHDLTASYDFFTEDGGGFGALWFAGSVPEGMRLAQLGDTPEDLQAFATVGSVWYAGEREYHTGDAREGSFYTGFTDELTADDLAQLTVRQGASLPDRTGALLVWADTLGTASGTFHPLPHTTEAFVEAETGNWAYDFWQAAADVNEALYFSDPREVEAGETYEETVNVGVFGPLLREGDGLFRDGNLVYGWINPHADGAGNHGSSAYTSGSTTLFRDGEEIASAGDVVDYVHLQLPAEEAEYELVTSIGRQDVGANVSTEVTASFTFTSAAPADGEVVQLPVSAVRFTPELALDSTGPAGETVTVPVEVQGAAADAGVDGLTVSVSTDGGETWEEAKVTDGAVEVTNPEAGGTVSFRAEVTDADGNVTTQTIIDAYRTA